MSEHTAIPWTDATWSPVTGCTKISPGCSNCYIERTPPFRMAGRKFVNGTTGVQLHPDRLGKPLHWRKPRRIFVCSLADLFHEDVPDKFIFDVFLTMARAPQHTFQVLTKRPERARDWFASFRKVKPFERARRVRYLLPPAGYWRDNYAAIGIEETFSNRVGTAVTLARVQGAILAVLPREMLVMPLPANYRAPHGWKALTVGKTNASKDEVREWAIDQGMPPGLAQDFYDAYAIARATRELLERGRAAA